MPDTRSQSPWFRRGILAPPISLTPAATILYLLTFLLALYQLDRQNYQSQKRDLIRDNFRTIFRLPTSVLQRSARQVLFASTPEERNRARQQLEQRMQGFVSGPTSIYEFSLRDPAREVVIHVSDPDKPRRLRQLTNTLFFTFSSSVDMMVSNMDDPSSAEGETGGYLTVQYTSPRDFPPIANLTIRYWMYVALLSVVWAAGYAFLYFRILRPMRRVTAHLANTTHAAPRLIDSPQVLLESNYNQMAAQALLQILEEQLTALLRPAEAGGVQKEEVISQALGSLSDWFGITDLHAAEVQVSDNSLLIGTSYAPAGVAVPSPADLLQRLNTFKCFTPEAMSGEGSELKQDSEFHSQPDGNLCYSGQLSPNSYFVVFGTFRTPSHKAETSSIMLTDVIRLACEKLRRGLIAYLALEKDVFRQKSEANIILSRNLGHDLTNIIATTKLDLMAIKKLLVPAAGDADLALSPNSPAALQQQAIRGILESTKFLQEIVNIYRSFSHIKRPQYERHNLNELIEEFLRVFEPSISSSVSLQRQLGETLPHPIIEPRLLKLAFFNVITNALDAYKRAPKPHLKAGDGNSGSKASVIVVRTRYDSVRELLVVEIEDNGPGIRDSEGRSLEPAEVEAIFRHGYSTKAAEASEGLGLSWVKTIIEQFHNGHVSAENRQEGGARFILAIRSMESAEAKVPQ